MGSQTTPLLTQFPITILHDFSKCRRRVCSSIRSRRDWERDVRQSPANQRFRFSDGGDEEDGFGFRNASNQRIWWYNGVDDDAGEYDVDEGFDIREASLGINMFVKIFQAFGWMIPAIAASLLMGTGHDSTGHDSTVTVLALPLAQTALSLLYDAIWARKVDSPWPMSKKKKKKTTPFARSGNGRRVRKVKEMYDQSENDVGDYKSWVDSDDVSAENEKKNFGGWDELDNELSVYRGANATKLRTEREPIIQHRVKSDRRTKGDTPLFIRLMIASFPFLDFWTRL